jgi:diaminopimelate decarboxylase
MKSDSLTLTKKFGTPLYVYDGATIKQKCRELKRALPNAAWYYACKANTHPEIMRLVAKEGFGIEAVSPGEIKAALSAGVPVSKITFTCSNIEEAELVWVVKQKIRVHLDSLHQVEVIGKHFPGSNISVRLNQGIGAGHHSHVVTGGPHSKFGIDHSSIKDLTRIVKKCRLRVNGIHQHIGSNILKPEIFLEAMDALLETAFLFPDLEYLDFGGGLGVPYKPGEKFLNVAVLGKKISRTISTFYKRYGREAVISFEPGRYLVAEAGFLAVIVTDIKRNPTKTFVGINSGFNHLLRPVLYNAYHEIINITRPHARMEKVTIAGNICESGDLFAKDRLLPMPHIGDVLMIKNVGAYGYTMSSDYNLRPKPRELFLKP